MKNIRQLFCFSVMALFLVALPSSCRKTPEVVGKWSASYADSEKKAGKIEMSFVLNITPNSKYSMVSRGHFVEQDIDKVFSQQSGVWVLTPDQIEFTPTRCQEIDDAYKLQEVPCQVKTIPQKVSINNGKWEMKIEDGPTLILIKEEVPDK